MAIVFTATGPHYVGPYTKSPAMTDPAPSVQPVRAWAVVDKDGKFNDTLLRGYEKGAANLAGLLNEVFEETAPHRVIRVEIREVNDE